MRKRGRQRSLEMIFMLNRRLAEAESMTHDVVRDLLGVKLDITSYASSLDQSQIKRVAEEARQKTAEAVTKAKELDTLRIQFTEERESWLQNIKHRQAETVAARIAAESAHERAYELAAENKRLKRSTIPSYRRQKLPPKSTN
eukprot:c20302_g1_i4 orf=493-921(-)